MHYFCHGFLNASAPNRKPKTLNYSRPKICAADFSISIHFFFTVELGSEDRIPQKGVSEFHTDNQPHENKEGKRKERKKEKRAQNHNQALKES